MPDYPLPSAPYTLDRAPDTGNCKIEICNNKQSQVTDITQIFIFLRRKRIFQMNYARN
jgi:hypothetical protein